MFSPFDKLITSLDLSAATPTFTYVSKAAILGDLGVGEDMFLDIGVLVGFSEGGVVAPGPGGGEYFVCIHWHELVISL